MSRETIATSVHEASHVVVLVEIGARFRSVSVVPRRGCSFGRVLDVTYPLRPRLTRPMSVPPRVQAVVMALVAGPLGQSFIDGQSFLPDEVQCGHDSWLAVGLLSEYLRAHQPQSVRRHGRIFDALVQRTERILARRRLDVARLGRELRLWGPLNYAEVVEALRRFQATSP